MSLRDLIVVSAFVVVCALCSPASAQNEGFQPNTDRPGNDFGNFTVGDAESCREACRINQQCRAWAFVKVGFQGPSARCFLKSPAPAARRNPCCTSGVIRKMD